MKKLFTTFAILLFIVGVVSGCSTIDEETSKSSEGDENQTLQGSEDEEYVMVTFQSGIDYWKGANEGMKEAAENLGVSTDFKGSTEHDVNEEVTVLNQVIAEQPDGIIVTAINSDALVEPINKAIDAGIPVVTFDSDSPESDRHAYLGTSNRSAGVSAANQMAELTDEKGKVAVISVPGQKNHEDRSNGFVDTIKNNYPDMEVVAVEDGKSDQTEAANAMSGILQSHGDLDGVFATEASEGVGVGTAVKQANKEDDINIISFDTDEGTLDMIKNDLIDATIAQGTWNMGYWGLNYLYNVKHDLVPENSDWEEADLSPLPPTTDTGVDIVTKENVDYFYED